MKLKETSSSAQPEKLNGIHNHDKQTNLNQIITSNSLQSMDTLISERNGKITSYPTEEKDQMIGENHIATSIDTPMRDDAFEMTDDEKMEKIAYHFQEIMNTLGLDLTDDSLQGTPKRVAKMYVKEIFKGLDPANKPAVKIFENKFGYNQLLVEKDISFYSNCEHHFVPIAKICENGS